MQTDTRVQVDLVTPSASRFGEEPLQQRAGVAAPARVLQRGEIVDIEKASPREVVPEPGSGDRGGALVVASPHRAKLSSSASDGRNARIAANARWVPPGPISSMRTML